ncbi:MAG: DUF2849 domain-containing protein [Hyphomicrobiaceae bacterium]|nr:DUF2849 domain-containing protein [Hyphomicrobiaceae bacterium]
MPKFEPSLFTANRLADGVVVYLAKGHAWVEDIAGALVATTPEALGALEAEAKRAVAARRVVAAYAVEVTLDAESGTPQVRSMRERIRAAHRTTLAYHRAREAAGPARALPASDYDAVPAERAA